MIKSEVIAEIARKTGISRSDVRLTIETLLQTIVRAMERGERVHFRNFGSFHNKKRAGKVARNISQNTAIIMAPHYVPAFKPSKVVIETIKASVKDHGS